MIKYNPVRFRAMIFSSPFSVVSFFRAVYRRTRTWLSTEIYVGRNLADIPEGALVVFPLRETVLCCGLAGLVAYKKPASPDPSPTAASLESMFTAAMSLNFGNCRKRQLDLEEQYLGGPSLLTSFKASAQALKREELFAEIFNSPEFQQDLTAMAERIQSGIEVERRSLSENMGHLAPRNVDIIAQRIEDLQDIHWGISMEVNANIVKVKNLINRHDSLSPPMIKIFKRINAVLNSIDRLEVRGRDSAGISLMFVFSKAQFENFREELYNATLLTLLRERTNRPLLLNNGINIHDSHDADGTHLVSLTITYKIAAEIGSLGDNVQFLRKQIRNDQLLQILASFEPEYYTVTAHTRWASIGAISEANCHPVDNETTAPRSEISGLIHVCLNGDIDNYLELKEEFEHHWPPIQEEITTDTKIIPLQIEKYLKNGHSIKEAFLMAVNDFEGSHAISMHTDLAPGKVFLAQKGSGQAIFIGIAEDHYMPVSEVYGFVEETSRYIKMDGETVVKGKDGKTQGQIFILNQKASGDLAGIEALYYNGSPVELSQADIKSTEITSRDIDRQHFPHYFLKEISEAPDSVAKTLQNRWKIKGSADSECYVTELDETVVPAALKNALLNQQIRRIFFMGQGTAGVAALACSDILNFYLNDPTIQVSALKASELSGFILNEHDDGSSMEDSLIVAISQSGTTTDTNRCVDMVRQRGARTLAIVNRRDSDLTFKVDGTLYTSSGRDIEMSVASTKAFYSQIVAGTILGLHIAAISQRRDPDFVSMEIRQLLDLPDKMREVLNNCESIRNSAREHAVSKTYWATVGSGPNKASADEIRIKLSELCYKTISSDFVEDKKHIDLSSEPLIIVCAAGTRENVIGDIVKDTAIFKAHKATPIVIADEGNDRFAPYADAVFHVPCICEHMAPILNTLVGHLWGYYAALSINDGSQFLYRHRENIQNTVDEFTIKGLNIFEVILEEDFREKIIKFYKEFKDMKDSRQLPASIGSHTATDLTLLLKYLSGRLPVTDFEMDFGIKGTPLNMLNTLYECIGNAVNTLARPVDAIKHQAKTVTVGTSRHSEKIEGLLFETLAENDISIAQITNKNVIVLKNLQGIVAGIKGYILYRIKDLNLLGEPTEETTIEIVRKEGILKDITSRVETDHVLKGTKRIIAREGNVYIGKGLKDGRSILVIPVISSSASSPNIIEYLLSLNVSFKEKVPLFVKIKALGGKFERLRNLIQEKSLAWDDRLLERVEIKDLFGDSAEKICEHIAANLQKGSL